MIYLPIFISVFCLVFCLLFFFYIKWYIKRKVSAAELLAEYRTEVYRLSAEINAITDRDSMLVEDRIKKLKEILEDTDKRVKIYVQELERNRTGEALYTSLGKGIRAALKTPADNQPSSDHAPELSTQTPKLTLIRQEKAPSSAPSSAQHEPKQYSKWQIRSQIEELVKENLSPQEIASRLKISITEVEIAMSMMNIKK
jgi:predicted DNA-binding protein YlxM (UPF0122 family)